MDWWYMVDATATHPALYHLEQHQVMPLQAMRALLTYSLNKCHLIRFSIKCVSNEGAKGEPENNTNKMHEQNIFIIVFITARGECGIFCWTELKAHVGTKRRCAKFNGTMRLNISGNPLPHQCSKKIRYCIKLWVANERTYFVCARLQAKLRAPSTLEHFAGVDVQRTEFENCTTASAKAVCDDDYMHCRGRNNLKTRSVCFVAPRQANGTQ